MRRITFVAVALLGTMARAEAHDIPDARVDRAIQVILLPGTLRLDYEVSLGELTLIQDLRQLGGEPSASDRRGWFEDYGRLTASLNARGLLVKVGEQDVDLCPVGFDLTVEGHPRFLFHFEAEVPTAGRLVVIDTNYRASEGTSRLALRISDRVQANGDLPPSEVSQIVPRPVWQMNDIEERRTRRLEVEYRPQGSASTPRGQVEPIPRALPASRTQRLDLTVLLDREGGRTWPALILVALTLGAIHALQPGHGKTIVAAASLGAGRGSLRGGWLGLGTALIHLISVLLIAVILWASRTTRPAGIHQALTHAAGFVIAALGLWRAGQALGGLAGHHLTPVAPDFSARGLLSLSIAGGIVPCWDAVALLLLAESLGRLRLGLGLLLAFSLGMALVLVGVGLGAGRIRAAFPQGRLGSRRLELAAGLILSVVGLLMLYQ